ncbi:MAG: hypothetical protein WDW36_007510 [Sanguina aurantia]
MSLYGTSSTVPSRWEAQGRSHPILLLKVDGLTVRYIGPAEDNKQAAAVKADAAIPPDLPLYYFEMTIKHRGLEGFIGIGFQVSSVNLMRLPGWEPRSYGYHGDDGHCFSGSGQGKRYGERFTAGDTIGALFDRVERTISFYKNGVDMGVAFSNVADTCLYPVVGLNTRGEEVTVNFGASAFVGPSISGLLAAQHRRLITRIQSFPLPSQPRPIPGSGSEPSLDLLPSLVMQHLVHHRYSQTAELLAADLTSTSRRGFGGDATAPAQQEEGPQQRERQQHEVALESAEDVDMSVPAAAEAATDTEMPDGGGVAEVAAEAAAAAEGRKSNGLSDLVDRIAGIAVRQQVYDALVAGSVDEVLSLLDQHYSREVLLRNPHLNFGLKVLKFARMIADNSSSSCGDGTHSAPPLPASSSLPENGLGSTHPPGAPHAGGSGSDSKPGSGSSSGSKPGSGFSGGTDAALTFGRAIMSSVGSEDEREVLEEVMSLFAYDEPWLSPAGYLLGAAHRVTLAEGLNGAILEWQGHAPFSAMERLGRQSAVLLEEAKKLGIPNMVGLNLQTILFSPPAHSQHCGPKH